MRARKRKEGNVSSSEGQNGRSLACRVAVSACEKAIYGLLSTRLKKKKGRRERGKTHPSSAPEASPVSGRSKGLGSRRDVGNDHILEVLLYIKVAISTFSRH